MPFAGERFQIYICDTSYLDVIQCELPFEMNLACLVFKVGPAQIRGFLIESYSQFGASLGLGKFDKYIPKIDPLFESLRCRFRSQAGHNRMFTNAKFIDQALFTTSFRTASGRRRILSHLLHFLPEAEGPHVSPDFLDVGQTHRFRPTLSYISPAERYFLIVWPDRVLLFMIHDYLINCCVFYIRIVQTHYYLL